MVKNNIKLVLEFQFDLKNPLKQPEMRIFEKWKIIVFSQNYGIFWPKGDLKPCIIMYLINIHNMSLVPVTFGNFFFQILQKWHFLGQIEKSQNGMDIFAQKCPLFLLQKLV